MSVCGLWQGTHRLFAVIIDDEGNLHPHIRAPATPDNAHHLLTYLASAGIGTLIIAEHSYSLIAQARRLKLEICLVPHDLLHAIRTATGLIHRPPRNTAILLARWPLVPALRAHLRDRRAAPTAKDQLALF